MSVQDAVLGPVVEHDSRSFEREPKLWLTERLVSVVVPAMNEAENLRHVLPLLPRWVMEVILVDGNSTDDTVAEAQRLWPGIRIVKQTGRGKGDALRCGFEAAYGDIIVMLDADGSTDPREIPAFVGALVAGADFVKGLGQALGGDVVVAEGDRVRLSDAAALGADCRAFARDAADGLAAARRGAAAPESLAPLTRAAELYCDDFLAGFALPENETWEEWQFFQRESFR